MTNKPMPELLPLPEPYGGMMRLSGGVEDVFSTDQVNAACLAYGAECVRAMSERASPQSEACNALMVQLSQTGPIDANKIEQIAKEYPDEFFLKGSGVLKLVGAIRQLEREARQPVASEQVAPVVPEGFALVPTEPTDEMQAAGAQAIRFDTTALNKLWTGNAVFRAMLAAAPSQQNEQEREKP